MPRLVPPVTVPTKRSSSGLWVGNLHRAGSQENPGSLCSWLAGIQILKIFAAMGLFCGVGTITTSHILGFVLKAQVGPGSLNQGVLKGQGVAQVFAAPKVWLPTPGWL